MELVKELFAGGACVYKQKSRTDNRGPMTYIFDDSIEGFDIKETRIYTMPKKGTFFGIHYREKEANLSKLVSVIRGRGLDYVIDLREDSETYLKWEAVEISGDNSLAVYIPAGFGHAFISLEDDTMQVFVTDKTGKEGYSKYLNYTDEKIGLKLPIPISEISDYDTESPILK